MFRIALGTLVALTFASLIGALAPAAPPATVQAQAVTGLSVISEGPTQATATVPVDSEGAVHLRFALAGTENWNSLSTTAGLTDTSVEISLNGLTPNAAYDVQASQDSSFPSTAATQSVTFTNRPAHLDLALDDDNPTGIWGNASTLWVVGDSLGPQDKRLYAYNRSDGTRDSDKDFDTLSDAGNQHLGGIWSDGTSMFVVDWDDDKVFAYGLSTRQRTAGADFDLDGSNDTAQGIWGNASTLWVAEDHDRPDNKLYAYNRSDGSRDYAMDFDTLNSAGNQSVKGIWSDGSTMMVADFVDKKLYGYHMGSKRRWARQDIDLVPENRNPKGVWGNDGKIWVANDGFGATTKVFAYYTPVVDTVVSDISLSHVTGTSATATVWIAASDGTARSVHLRHREEASAAWSDAPSQTTSAVNTAFMLTGLSGGARYVVQASFDSTFSDGTEVSAEFQARPQDQDFRLAVGNGDAKGVWSDGSTMWVVNDGSGDDDRVYAYTVSSKAHDAGNSFDLDSSNAKPGGVYANADVMWVPDGDDDSVYAYTITSGNSYGDVDASKGFALHTGTGLADIIVPTGAWSDGSTLWVAGHVREQVYAYNIGSTGTFGARDMSKECELATDYASPRGMWSNGSTLWVVDSTEHRIFAYDITSDGCGEGQLLREIRLADGNSDAWGIWSNGTTLWVADAEDNKVYAYTLPPAPSGDVTGLALDRITATAADITVTIANPDATERSVELTYEAASGGTLVTSTASTSDTSAEFNLAGLTANAHYSLQVRVDSGSVVRTGGFRTQSSTDRLREYLKNTIVGGWETARPWVRETYNAMRRHHVPVVASELRLTAGLSGRISSSCFLAVGSELSKCFVREFHMDDRSLRHLGTLIHELAHVHTFGSGYADEPAEYLGMGWLYFRDLAEGGTDCDVSELYAGGISYAHEPASQYYFDQCSHTGNMPSAATTEAVESVLAGQTPDWFKDEYEGEGLSYDTSADPKYDREYDLERVWDDLLLLDSRDRDAAVYQFRNAFGGYCDPTEAYQAGFGFGTTRIPWRAGGCIPQAPAIDSVTGVVQGLTVAWIAPDGDAVVSSYDLRYIETSADEMVETNWTVRSAVWTSGDLTATVTGLALGTQYDVQVRAVNAAGAGPWSTTRTGTTLFSDDATLTGLTLSGVRLTPGFTSGGTSYAGAVGYTVTGATVAATRSDGNAAVVILDGNGNTLASAGTVRVNLSVGANIIRVRVTAQDGLVTMTYTVTVRRTELDQSLTPPASDPVAPFASTAVYTIQFQGDWTTAATLDGVPVGAHFSRLIGAVHNAGVTFLESGGTASPGVESMAEVGGTSALRNAVTNAGRNALGVVEGDTNSIGPTTLKSLMVTLSTDHPRVTLVTMIAPSPDWFVGVSGLSLLDSGGNWLSSVEVQLYPWDAGTENGSNFSLSNPATSPRGVITSIRGTGKFSTERIATLTSTLESVNFAPTGAPFITGATGAPQVGEELAAHTSAIDDRNGLTSPGYDYQWLRVDAGGQAAPIAGATSATYSVQAADVGKRLAVRVSFTDDDSNLETLTSDVTAAAMVTQVTVSFGAGGHAAAEGGGRATVKVMLDKDPHRTLRIPLHATTGGGADSSDYTAPAQVTFRPGETAEDLEVTAADDRDDDDGESVTLAFGDLPDGVSAGSPSETLVQFIDDDYVPVTLGWEETAYTAEEPTSPGATTAVTLRAAAVTATDKRPESGFALAFTVNTANGTAREPDDYEELTATETFDRNDFTRTTVDGQSRYVATADFTVTVAHDTVDEPLERFTVRLALAGSGQPHLSLGDSTATVTVTDDVASLADLRTTVFADAGAVEPGGQLTYNWSVYNSGPAAATSTVLTGTLDAGVTFVSAQVTSPATGQCGRSGRTVTCTVGTLEDGGTASGEVVVAVKDDASADMGFTAVAGADQLDRTPSDDDDAVTTALVAAPGRITNLRATGGRRAIELTWSPPGDNGSAITGYELERRPGAENYAPVIPQPPQGTTSYRDEGVAEGTEYTYRLRAVNEDGEGAWSNEPVASLHVAPPPVSSGGGSSGGGGGGGGGGFGPSPVAPSFVEGFRTERVVAENARAGDPVGDPVSATHPDELEIAYSLSGTDAAFFTVDEKTGQIQVKEGVDLTLGKTYTANLTATDSAGFGAIIIVVIEVAESMHHRYDLNGNGVIERDEVIAAVADYFNGDITKGEVIELVTLYFAGWE